ncbi:MAG: hypothetical protein R3C26_03245 [Calditrichia bacterium]
MVGNNIKLFENEIMFSKWREFSAAGINDGRFAILTKSQNRLFHELIIYFFSCLITTVIQLVISSVQRENSVIESPVIAMNDSGYATVCWVGGDKSISISVLASICSIGQSGWQIVVDFISVKIPMRNLHLQLRLRQMAISILPGWVD